jgi:hypothetical protein
LFKEEDTTSLKTTFVISCNKEIQMMFVIALSSLDIFATYPTYLEKIQVLTKKFANIAL